MMLSMIQQNITCLKGMHQIVDGVTSVQGNSSDLLMWLRFYELLYISYLNFMHWCIFAHRMEFLTNIVLNSFKGVVPNSKFDYFFKRIVLRSP
jgi:hypothetical protein